jgi:hypothetical protein
MPYTNTWDDTRIPGSTLAKLIDEEFRRVRLDIHQRMDDIVEDWLVDPVVLKGSFALPYRSIDYNDDNSQNNKVTSYITIRKLLRIRYIGDTNVLGQITINLNEVLEVSGTEDWQVADLSHTTFDIFSIQGFRTVGLNVPIFGRSLGYDAGNNLFIISFFHGDGVVVQNHPIFAEMILVFTTPL